ncbi:MAG TPA: hypothetical protein VEC93_08630 [Anaerolineae bacterium]|nr:hypothetical protein [Anaerolineae bacterium]
MTKQKPARQIWWPLVALALIMIGLVFLAHRVAPSPGWRTFLDVGIVVFCYGLMALWLETHSTILLHPPTTAADNLDVKSSQLEIPSLSSSHVRCYFYVGSDPAIIYGGPEQASSNLSLNGHHHVARTTPSLPEEAAE